jgi:hypothetical protein
MGIDPFRGLPIEHFINKAPSRLIWNWYRTTLDEPFIA